MRILTFRHAKTKPCGGFPELGLRDAELSLVQSRTLAVRHQHTTKLTWEVSIHKLETLILKADRQICRRVSIHQLRVEENRSWHVLPSRALDGLSHIWRYQCAIANNKFQWVEVWQYEICTSLFVSARLSIIYVEDHRTFMSINSWVGWDTPALVCTLRYISFRFADDRSCSILVVSYDSNESEHTLTQILRTSAISSRVVGSWLFGSCGL